MAAKKTSTKKVATEVVEVKETVKKETVKKPAKKQEVIIQFAGREVLEKEGIVMAEAEVKMLPQTYVELTDETAIKNLQKTLDLLEDDDDVQYVWHNWDE